MNIVDKVYEQLKFVLDPELNINVVDLGLIYNVNINDDYNVTIEMTLTTPGCPLHDSIVGGVRAAVQSVEGVNNVHVEVVWEPAWTPERITEDGRKLLGVF